MYESPRLFSRSIIILHKNNSTAPAQTIIVLHIIIWCFIVL